MRALNESRNNGPECHTSSSLDACWKLFWSPSYLKRAFLSSQSGSLYMQVHGNPFCSDKFLPRAPDVLLLFFVALVSPWLSAFSSPCLCLCACVCLPSLALPYPSASSSCLGASSSTPPLSRGTAAGPAPAARGTCPPGHTDAG